MKVCKYKHKSVDLKAKSRSYEYESVYDKYCSSCRHAFIGVVLRS